MKVPTAGYAVSRQEQEGDFLTLQVEVKASIVKQAYKKVHRMLVDEVRVPGFRAGKAPLQVLARRIGQERFDAEVERELLPAYYYAAVRASGKRPIDRVEYEDQHLAYGKPFAFTAKVIVAPPVEMGDYDGLDVKPPVPAEPTDEEIREELQRLRRRAAKLQRRDSGSVEKDCLAFVSYEGKVDGKTYKTLSAMNRALLVGEDEFLPGFDAELVGIELGGEKTFTLPLGDEAPSDFLKGKTAEFEVKVASLQDVTLPELDDDFAKDVGDFKSLADLEERIQKDLLERKERDERARFTRDLKDRLAEVVQVDLPASLLEKEVEDEIDEIKNRLLHGGMRFEEYLEENGKDEESFKAEITEQVEKKLRLQFALDGVAEKEKLEATEAEVAQRVQLQARLIQRNPEELEAILDASGSLILKFDELAREKALSLLRERYDLPKKEE